MYLNKINPKNMKHIKFLLAVALVSVFVISCKETPKVEEVQEEVVIEELEVVEEAAVDSTTVMEVIEVAIDSTAVIVE